MNVENMKNILAQKLKEENSYLTKSHINMEKHGEDFTIVIKDYEHIYFKMRMYHDDDLGYVVSIYDSFDDCEVVFVNNEKFHDLENALIDLGYHIGNTF